MTVRITNQPFDPWREVRIAQKPSAKIGATTVFVGSMRDFNNNRTVQQLTLEHYPAMSEKHLADIVAESQQKWQVLDILLLHRVGVILPAEPIVLVAVWSSHRSEAINCNNYIVEKLKASAPFWKKELLASGDECWATKTASKTSIR